jgi:hypothetical protein
MHIMPEKRVRVALGAILLAVASLAAGGSGSQSPTGAGYGSGTYDASGFGGYGTTPYNYDYGGGVGGFAGFGGFGSTPYNYSYGVRTGQPGTASQATGHLYQQVQRASTPQTSEAVQPLYDIVTTETDWSRPRRAARRRRGPSVPRERLLDNNGAIRWPIVAPGGPALADSRRDAEDAVRSVVDEGKKNGHASIRRVIDAKAKLADFARHALPDLKSRNAAGADGLEAFIVELRKTLESMAARY